MKNKTLLSALSLICILSLIGGSFAFYSYEKTATNVFTSSSLDVELLTLKDVNGELVDASGDEDILPGVVIERIVKVKNISKEDAWIRVLVTINDDIVKDNIIGFEDLNTADWTYKDGYYYYSKALKADETTSELFKGLRISEKLNNDYSNEKFSFKIEAQATQVKNNGSSATDASGWPE